MSGEFEQYDKAPWFWFYMALTIAADVCENPMLSAKYQSNNKGEQYPFDMYGIFEDAVERYNLNNRGRKERYY